MDSDVPKAGCGGECRGIRLAGTGEGAHYPQMSMNGTRNLLTQAVLLVGALALAAPAAAEGVRATDLRVQVAAAPAAAQTQWKPPSLLVGGRAPARCAPVIERASVHGNNLDVELATPASACNARTSVPFRLDLGDALAGQAPILPGQVYRTRILGVADGTATLLSFGLLDTNPAEGAPQPENGMWWSESSSDTGPAMAGNGVSLEWQDGQVAATLFGFGETGEATWFFGTGTTRGRVAAIPLVRLANGDPAFTPLGNQPSTQDGPRLELEFLSPSRARAWLVRSEGGNDIDVRALTLSRSTFADGPLGRNWDGRWVLVPDDGGAPRVFDFTAAGSRDAENFQLVDATQDIRLECRLVVGTRHPAACALSGLGFGPIELDQIGLDRMSGRTESGGGATLMRVAPH